MSVWQCQDCHTVGFYFDKTPQEVQDEHMLTCHGKESPMRRMRRAWYTFWRSPRYRVLRETLGCVLGMIGLILLLTGIGVLMDLVSP